MPRGGTCYYLKMGWKQKTFWAVLIVALVIGYGFLFTADCSAQSAVVLFNDAEQLAAISDSIVGVCDTTVMTITRMEEGHSAIADSFRFVLDTVGTTITCRELVCVTVVPEPYGPTYQTTGAIIDTRQWAIIFYEEVK